MYIILKKARVLVLSVTLLVFFTTSSFQITSKIVQDDPIQIVVSIENLDPYIYKDILLASREDESLDLIQSCIPSKLLLFEKMNPQIPTSDFKLKVKELIEISSIASAVEITDYNKEQFETICSESRTGQ